MSELASLAIKNQERWNRCRVTRDFSIVARRLVAFKPRYMTVSNITGVPWFIIAVIHYREGDGRWDTQLAQGDPLHERSRHEPAGRGPFNTWEDGAVDALMRCPPYAANWNDWSPGGSLALLEGYNGLGYFLKGVPSPYVWSGTDQYVRGKYVRDGVYDPHVLDMQLGCAGLLKAMQKLDPTIQFGAPQKAPSVAKRAVVKTKHVATAGAAAMTAVGTEAAGLSPVLTALAILGVGALVYYLIDRRG